MSPQEIAEIVRAAAELGANRIKITGGEPLVRSDVPLILRQISSVPYIKDLSLVTNGTLLTDELAEELKREGLRRLNINIPSIEPKTYARLTGGDLSKAIRGVEAAKKAGLYPIKINMVALAGQNEAHVDSMIEFARANKAILQIIELEPLHIHHDYYREHHLDLENIERKIADSAKRVKSREHMQGRKIYSLPGVDVEIVRPVENTGFCLHCTRVRLTSDGRLKLCLMTNDALVDLLIILRSRGTANELRAAMTEAIKARKPFYVGASDPC
jgi:cyclic pyranopterin phosphate synthase